MMYEVLWRPRGAKHAILLAIVGSHDPSVVFRHTMTGEAVPPEEILFVPYRPFDREWKARSALFSLVETDRENADAEGREPNAALILALALVLDREPTGRAAELKEAIEQEWLGRLPPIGQDPAAAKEVRTYSMEELLEGKTDESKLQSGT